jgi:tetratricopeptide (TPR) repeat protein
MAKQRRPSKPTKDDEKVVPPLTTEERPARKELPQPPAAPSYQPPVRRSTYVEAVAVYERGVEALQRHDYGTATQLFETVLRQYPEEKELHERVRLYLNVCQRQTSQPVPEPQTVEERLFASTLAINGGRYDDALAQLHLVRDEDPDNDHALYMLAVAHAQRGELVEAVAHLLRAIAVNPENRSLARHDPDLEPLRDDESFRAALEIGRGPRVERRRIPIRTRANDRR